jgi:hypothetical protein
VTLDACVKCLRQTHIAWDRCLAHAAAAQLRQGTCLTLQQEAYF